MLFFFPLDVLAEICDVTESVSEVFLTYSSISYYVQKIIVVIIIKKIHSSRKVIRNFQYDTNCSRLISVRVTIWPEQIKCELQNLVRKEAEPIIFISTGSFYFLKY